MTNSPFRSNLEERMETLIRKAIWNEVLGRAANAIVPLSEGIAGRPPFYCVHALSGAGSLLGDLARMLGPEQPFFAIQAPHKKRNAAFAASIEGMAEYYVDALLAFQPAGPLVLGGWSVGSIIAFEMAQQLRWRGHEDILLVNIDCEFLNVKPAISRRNPRYYWRVARNFPVWLSYEIRGKEWSAASFAIRIRNRFAASARMAWTRAAEGKLDRGHAVNGFMDTSRFSPDHKAFVASLYDALYHYVPAPYAGPVVIYEASVQPVAHLRQVAATWRRVTRPEIVPVTGTHSSIIKPPDGTVLAEHLRHRLAGFAAAAPDPVPRSGVGARCSWAS